MYKKISEYDNVAYYDANTEHVVYYLQNDTKKHIWIDDLDLKFAYNGFLILGNDICVMTDGDGTYKYDPEIRKLVRFHDHVFYYAVDVNGDDTQVVAYETEKGTNVYINSSCDILFESDIVFWHIYNNYGFTLSDDKIKCYELPNKFLWEYDFFKLPLIGEDMNDKLDQVIGMINDQVWCRTYYNRKVVLDIKTGEVVEIMCYDEQDSQENNFRVLNFADRLVGDEIIGVGIVEEEEDIYAVCIVDPITREEKSRCIINEIAPEIDDMLRINIYQDHFTFVDLYGHHAGVFNFRTNELEWYDRVIESGRLTGDLRMHGNKLYIDQYTRLHVFEKE